MGQSLNSLIFFPLSVLIYQAYKLLSQRLLQRKLYRTHRCESIPRYQHADGLWRQDLQQKRKEAYATGQAAPFAQSLFSKHGTTWLETSWDRTTVHTCDARNIQAVAASSFSNFGLQPLREGLSAPFIDRGILNTDGAFWSHSRALIRPTFARTQISDFVSFETHLRRALELIPRDGSTVDLQPLFKRLVSYYRNVYHSNDPSNRL